MAIIGYNEIEHVETPKYRRVGDHLEAIMPTKLVPNEDIPKLAAQIQFPAMARLLRLVQQRGVVRNGKGVDPELVAGLKRLTDLGLVDLGYAGPTGGEPFVWVINQNGERVLNFLETNPPYRVKIHSRARTALDTLSEADREAVLAAAESLARCDPDSWPPANVVRLGLDKPVYLLRVSPGLRAFISILASRDIELVDIVREETLQLFLEREPLGAPSK